MDIFELCPIGRSTGEKCKKLICQYKNTKGQCSLMGGLEDREYSVEEIAEILQISRHRVWRIYNNVLDKIKQKANPYDWKQHEHHITLNHDSKK